MSVQDSIDVDGPYEPIIEFPVNQLDEHCCVGRISLSILFLDVVHGLFPGHVLFAHSLHHSQILEWPIDFLASPSVPMKRRSVERNETVNSIGEETSSGHDCLAAHRVSEKSKGLQALLIGKSNDVVCHGGIVHVIMVIGEGVISLSYKIAVSLR